MTPLTVHVSVNARNIQRAAHWDGQRLHVRLAAPPRENAANTALINLLAELLSVPKTTIHLKRGHHSKEKQLTIPLTEHALLTILEKNR